MLEENNRLITAIERFRNREINFAEYEGWLRTTAFGLGSQLDFERDWARILDAWLEHIKFGHPEEDWYDLGCSLGAFLEDAIINEPRPLKLPENDRVVREHFLKK